VKSQVSASHQEIKKSARKQKESEKDVQSVKSARKQKELEKDVQSVAHLEGKAKNISAVSPEADSKLKHSEGEGNDEPVEEVVAGNKEGDLRAELSRRRAERLTKVSLCGLD
jgi:predicted  nucleic acid-binding Zn-ribbon protein